MDEFVLLMSSVLQGLSVLCHKNGTNPGNEALENLISERMPEKKRKSTISRQEFLDFQNALLGMDVSIVDVLKKAGSMFAAEADDMGMFAVEAQSAGDQSAPPPAVVVVREQPSLL